MNRRVVVRRFGGPEVLELLHEPIPIPRRGQVRVRVEVAGVAFGDVMRRRGVLAPPWSFTPGYDVVGLVDAQGKGADSACPPLGARVAALMPGPGFGGYADYVCVAARELVPVPDGLDAETALALGLNYITAHQLITRTVPLRAGQRLLVHGAAGGVGCAVLDLGQRAGLELFGTASRAKHVHLEARGCEAIDYRAEDFVQRLAGRPVAAVLDPIGGAHLRRSLRTLERGGTLVSFGVSGDVSRGLAGVAAGFTSLLACKLRPDGRRVRMYNITLSPGASRAACRRDWASLLALGAQGALAPTIGAVFPLEQVRDAHDLIDRAGVVGKIVLRCGAPPALPDPGRSGA